MSRYAELYVADLRLAILQLLMHAGFETNISIIKAGLAEATQHRPGGEQVRAEISWLAERGLVYRRAIGATVEAATITERGEDVACGRAQVPGVHRPLPDDAAEPR